MTTISLDALEDEYPPLRWQHRYEGEEEWQEGSQPKTLRPGKLQIRVLPAAEPVPDSNQ